MAKRGGDMGFRGGYKRFSKADELRLHAARLEWITQDITGVSLTLVEVARRYEFKYPLVLRRAKRDDWHAQRSQRRSDHARNERLAHEVLSKQVTEEAAHDSMRTIKDLIVAGRTGLRWAMEVLVDPDTGKWRGGKAPQDGTVYQAARWTENAVNAYEKAEKLLRLIQGEATERVEHTGGLAAMLSELSPALAARLVDMAGGEGRIAAEERMLKLDEQERARDKEASTTEERRAVAGGADTS